jgi:hypothetical protein
VINCAVCGRKLVKGKLRYITRIVSYAAYDPLEISYDDLRLDLEQALKKALAQVKGKKTRSLQDDIIKTFHYDLCPRCRRRYVKDPLGGIPLFKK